MGTRVPACHAGNAHRKSRRPSWSVHGPGYYSPPLKGVLQRSDSVAALAWNPKRKELAVSNGSVIDILSPLGVKFTISLNLNGTLETATTLSYYGPYLYAASANDSKLYHVPSATIVPIGTAGVVDALIGSTQDDSNPHWQGDSYTLPREFLIVAQSTGFEIFDIATGSPVSDRVELLTDTTSFAYRAGRVYGGTSTGGLTEYDYVSGVNRQYTTVTTPAIVSDVVNDVAATVLDGAADATQGLKVPTWAVATDGGVSVGVDTGDVWDITGFSAPALLTGFTADQKVYSNYIFQSRIGVWDIPSADVDVTTFIRRYVSLSEPTVDEGAPKINRTSGAILVDNGPNFYVGAEQGITVINEDTANYFNGAYAHITAAPGYNTGYMVGPDGAWANDTDTTPIVATGPLVDNSGQGNNATVTGNANRTQLGTSGLYGVEFTTAGTITGTAAAGGQLAGFEYIDGAWFYRRSVDEFENATDDSINWTINAQIGYQYAFLIYNGTPMTNAQAADTAADLAGIIDDEPNGETC